MMCVLFEFRREKVRAFARNTTDLLQCSYKRPALNENLTTKAHISLVLTTLRINVAYSKHEGLNRFCERRDLAFF